MAKAVAHVRVSDPHGVAQMSAPPAQALAAGVDGLFLETHPDPAHAPSDGPNMLPLKELEPLVRRAVAVWEAARG